MNQRISMHIAEKVFSHLHEAVGALEDPMVERNDHVRKIGCKIETAIAYLKRVCDRVPDRVPMKKYYGGEIKVGQYHIIGSGVSGFYWIEHEGGEAMQVGADKLEALITQFYADNF